VTWVDLYLFCLIVGLSLSVISLLTGTLHIHLHGGHVHFGGHAGHAGHAGHPRLSAGQARPGGGNRYSFANLSSLLVFLAWFGGAGVLLRGGLRLPAIVALLGAVVSGLFGAYLVFLFVQRVLLAHDHELRPADYAMVGTLAKVSLAIRPGSTGEIVYVQGGTRKSAAARAEDGGAFPIGTEVVVARFDDGVAYVRSWQSGEP
jgi:membrane protein implicated in regulation of membrane protease activity